MRRNAYLAAAIGAALVLTRTVEFAPPPQVRVRQADVTQVVGDARPQEFSPDLGNPQAVQLRATLRLYPDPQLDVGEPDPEIDELGKLLSQPVVTTILGMNAAVEQTLRLDGGTLEADVSLHATPRLVAKSRRDRSPSQISLEYDFSVRSRKHQWYSRTVAQRVHFATRGILREVEEHGHRVVFTVDDHLLSLDLEVHRPGVPAATLANTR